MQHSANNDDSLFLLSIHQELVRLTIEKQEHPSPTSPVKPSLPACKSDRWVTDRVSPVCRANIEGIISGYW